MRRGLKRLTVVIQANALPSRARGPYEKGTETWEHDGSAAGLLRSRARGPYEKGTETEKI